MFQFGKFVSSKIVQCSVRLRTQAVCFFPDKKLAIPLQGLDLFPSPFTCPIWGTSGTCIPQDEVARHWPCIVKIINDYARELEQPDKIVYIFDPRVRSVTKFVQLSSF